MAATRAKRRPDRPQRTALRGAVTLGLCVILAGCGTVDRWRGANVVLPDPGLRFVAPFGSGREPCQIAGPTEFTEPFLAAGRVLVACPAGYSGGFALVEQQGATQVARTRKFTLYSVPAVPGADAAAAVTAVSAATSPGPQPVLQP